MGRPHRCAQETEIQFVSCRTLDSKLVMAPSEEVSERMGAIVARAQRMFPVEIFSYVFMCNHIHLSLRGKSHNISHFMKYVLGNTAKAVNKQLHTTGKVWAERYKIQPILDDESTLEKMVYVASHGAKEGLVDRCEQWPGLKSIDHARFGTVRSFTWRGAGGPTNERLHLSTPSFWAGSVSDLCRKLVNDGNERAQEVRAGQPALGLNRVLATAMGTTPAHTKRTRAPICHATRAEDRRMYKARIQSLRTAYAEASARYRAGKEVEFPEGMFPPWREQTFL